jgi:hypothetical protein
MLDFDDLSQEQQEIVLRAHGTVDWVRGYGIPVPYQRRYECPGCARYLGETPLGAHTYYAHYGVSSWYEALDRPPSPGGPRLDYETGDIIP